MSLVGKGPFLNPSSRLSSLLPAAGEKARTLRDVAAAVLSLYAVARRGDQAGRHHAGRGQIWGNDWPGPKELRACKQSYAEGYGRMGDGKQSVPDSPFWAFRAGSLGPD